MSRQGQLRVMLLTVGLEVGGTEGQIMEIASRLDCRRFDVCVCALKGTSRTGEVLRRRGIRVHALGGRNGWDIRVLFRLFRVIGTERPDVIHSFLFRANVVARVLVRLFRRGILISSYRNLGDSARWYERWLDRLTAPWAHAFTCSSDAVREAVRSHVRVTEQNCVTIHNGVDVERFARQPTILKSDLGLRSDLPIIGTVSRLVEPGKGLSILLGAMAEMVGSSGSQPCQLLIVGDGPASQDLRDLSGRLGLAPWVVFAGIRHDIPRLLPMMSVFILPSLSEGFGIAIIEAMAAGCPVVATVVGGIPEIVVHGETGLLVPPGDSSALATAIQDLLADPAKAQGFGRRGRQRVKECFAIEAAVKRHERLYEDLVARRSREDVP